MCRVFVLFFKGLWVPRSVAPATLLWHSPTQKIWGTPVEGPSLNSSETVGPKEKAKEDNSAPVSCIIKTCGKDRNSIDWDSLHWTKHNKVQCRDDLTVVWLQWAGWSNGSFPSLPLWWGHLHENRVIVPPRFICFPSPWHHDCPLWEALCSRLRSQWVLGEEGARAALQEQRSHFRQASPVKQDRRSEGTDAKAQNMQYRQGNSYTRNPDWPHIPFAPHIQGIQSWDLPFQNLELS